MNCDGSYCEYCEHYSKIFGCLIELSWEVWEELRKMRLEKLKRGVCGEDKNRC